MTEYNRVPSPCVRNCCLNELDICLGCFRSLEEICGWSQADDTARQHILDRANLRRQEYCQHRTLSNSGV